MENDRAVTKSFVCLNPEQPSGAGGGEAGGERVSRRCDAETAAKVLILSP